MDHEVRSSFDSEVSEPFCVIVVCAPVGQQGDFAGIGQFNVARCRGYFKLGFRLEVFENSIDTGWNPDDGVSLTKCL